MSITIKESVEFETYKMTVTSLKDAVTKGDNDFNSLFSTAAGVLQRINQKEAWIKDNFKRSKEFMNCVITGAGALDNIIIVPIELVLKSLKRKAEIHTDVPKEVWNEILIMMPEVDSSRWTSPWSPASSIAFSRSLPAMVIISAWERLPAVFGIDCRIGRLN